MVRSCTCLVLIMSVTPSIVGQDKKLTAKDHFEQGKGFSRSKSGDGMKKAIAAYSEAIRLDPKMVEAYCGRGHAFLKENKFDSAIADLTKALKLDPKYKDAYIYRGRAYHQLKLYDGAITDFTKALTIPRKEFSFLELAFDLALLYQDRASALHGKKNYDEAIVDYSRSLLLWQDNPDARFARGNARIETKDYDGALHDFDFVARLIWKEMHPIYISHRGLARFYKKEYEKALKDFDAADKIEEDGRWTALHRATMLATCADPKYRDGKKAIDEAKRAIDRRGFVDIETKCYVALAAAYAEAGDFAEAVRYQQEALADAEYRDDKEMRARLELYKKKQPFRQP